MSARNKFNYAHWQVKWRSSGAIAGIRKSAGGGDFNQNYHPERRPDEVFVTNADDDTIFTLDDDGLSSYQHVGWKTKRRGDVSYDIHGKPLGERWPHSFPVFVKQSEIAAKDPKILERMLPTV